MPIDVRAAIYQGAGKRLVIDTVQLEGPSEGEVLVEMSSTGLCHSDLNILDGAVGAGGPMILGHEGAGIVVECGPGVSGLKKGDRVVPTFLPECRQCDYCTSGRTNLCREFFRKPDPKNFRFRLEATPIPAMADLGTFATHAVIREISLARIRDDAPMDLVSYIGCGVITGVGAVISTARVSPGSKVIVFGLGGIGLNVVQAARLSGAGEIIGVDTNPAKAVIARTMGLTQFVNPKDFAGSVVDHLVEVTGGGGDYVFECVGSVALQRQAIEATRVGWGECILVGYPPVGQELSFPPRHMMTGRKLVGSLMGGLKGRSSIPMLVDWYMNRKIEVDSLVSHKLRLEEINHGFDLMRRGEAVRSVVVY